MKNIFAIIVLVFSLSAYAGDEHSIIAVVNGNAISNYDVKSRLDLLIKTTNLPEKARLKMLPQVIRLLINDELKKEEAKKFKLEVTDEELKYALSSLAKQNNVSDKELKKFLKSQGISYNELRKKTKSEILWSKIVKYRVRPLVKIRDSDIKNEIKFFNGETQFYVSKIVLPIEDYKKSEVETIFKDINNKNFEKIEKEFSIAPTDPEWISNDIIKNAEVGTITEPIKVNNDFVIFNILDKRTLVDDSIEKADFKIKHLSISLAEDATDEQTARATINLRKVERRKNVCKVDYSEGDIFEFTMNTKLKDLSPRIANTVAKMKLGQRGKTFYQDGNLYMILLCDRKMPPRKVISNEKIKQSVFSKKLNQEIVNYIHMLNKDAIIEIRE